MIRRIPWGIHKPSLGVRHNPSHPLSYGLVSHWIMNESSGLITYDISGNGNNGTLTNGPTWTQRHFGTAIQFDGSNDVIAVNDSDIFSFGNGTTDSPFSVSAWIFVDSVTGEGFGGIATKYTTTQKEWEFRKNNDERLSLLLYDQSAGGENARRSAANSLTFNTWIHVVGTYDGRGGSAPEEGINLYLNAVLDNTSKDANAAYVAMENGTANLAIGDRVGGGIPFGGLIDDVRIYNRALSAGEISYLYIYPFGDLMPRRQILMMPAAAAGRIFKLAGRGGGLAGPSIGLAG